MMQFELLRTQIVEERSVYQTALEAARFHFDGGRWLPEEAGALLTWLLDHPNRSRGYTFHPTPYDVAQGIRLFTGEKPRTWLARRDGVEMETLGVLARLLASLDADGAHAPHPHAGEAVAIFAAADHRLEGRCYGSVCPVGECALASIAVLRYRTARAAIPGAAGAASHLRRGLALLRETRTADGGWRTFPFFFTLLWLTELAVLPNPDLQAQALDELTAARTRCRRLVARPGRMPAPVEEIRRTLLRRALAVP